VPAHGLGVSAEEEREGRRNDRGERAVHR
jgi:hypothetical protein